MGKEVKRSGSKNLKLKKRFVILKGRRGSKI
jgi:hypothetical protein